METKPVQTSKLHTAEHRHKVISPDLKLQKLSSSYQLTNAPPRMNKPKRFQSGKRPFGLVVLKRMMDIGTLQREKKKQKMKSWLAIQLPRLAFPALPPTADMQHIPHKPKSLMRGCILAETSISTRFTLRRSQKFPFFCHVKFGKYDC